nr:vacuolar protein sorting-associated protein 2 homolog 2-like [Coffea arabica]
MNSVNGSVTLCRSYKNMKHSSYFGLSSPMHFSCISSGIEREIASLQMEEKKLVAEIKKTAKTGNEAATKILARQLVRLRQQIVNLQGSRAQIRGVATHTQALYASTSISTGMKGATKAMTAMNKEMAPTKQAKVIKEFQKQSAQMDMTIEMMSESIDETLDKDEAEEETEELTNQVLDEIGVDIASQLSSAPKGRIAAKKVDNAAPLAAYAICILQFVCLAGVLHYVPAFASIMVSKLATPGKHFLQHLRMLPASHVGFCSATADVEDLEKRLASLRRI